MSVCNNSSMRFVFMVRGLVQTTNVPVERNCNTTLAAAAEDLACAYLLQVYINSNQWSVTYI
ncbi:hypothetical protein ACE1OE_03490 [Vibrio sp. E150_011]